MISNLSHRAGLEMGRKGSSRQTMPGQGGGHSMMASQQYVSEEESSGSFHSAGLTGAVFQEGGK